MGIVLTGRVESIDTRLNDRGEEVTKLKLADWGEMYNITIPNDEVAASIPARGHMAQVPVRASAYTFNGKTGVSYKAIGRAAPYATAAAPAARAS